MNRIVEALAALAVFVIPLGLMLLSEVAPW